MGWGKRRKGEGVEGEVEKMEEGEGEESEGGMRNGRGGAGKIG